MSVTLLAFDFPCNIRAWKIIAAANIAGININFTGVKYDEDNLTNDYLNNCHPMGRTPVLQTEEGYIFESNAILRHIARVDQSNSGLYGRTLYESSQVDQWLDYTGEFTEASSYFVHSLFGAPTTDESTKKMLDEAHAAYAGLDRWLENRTFLVGERMTIADVAIAAQQDWILRYCGAAQDEFTKKYKNAMRHYGTVMNHPAFVAALQANGHAIGLPKPEKPKKVESKPEKKAEKKDAVLNDNDDDDLLAPEEKAKNPLDLLPPSSFILDAFKREYSNKDTRKEAAPFLFDKFDNEGFTAFWCKYKYNSELTQAFMTSNLIRGWFQRMDHVRKYAFSSTLIIGEEGKTEIVGFWIFRGKGIPAVVNEVDDSVLYDWFEIKDIKAEADKITDYLAWDGTTFENLPVLEGRVFK